MTMQVSDQRPLQAHRKACRACLGTDLEPLLDLGDQPLAGGFLSDAAAIKRERRFPLVIHVCAGCGLVQILDPVDPDVLFQDYSFSSSTVRPLVAHFEAYARRLIEDYAPKTVVEFGCNDGILLKPLQEAGVLSIGVDPSQNITDIARSKGLNVVTGYFDVAVAEQIRAKYGPADIVSGSNAFAHNDAPDRILEAANAVLGPDGRLVLEFMYAGDLLEQLQWDTLYHEHLTFYSLETVSKLLKRFGFFVEHAERLPMHGGSLRVVATKKENPNVTESAHQLLASERASKLNEITTWNTFTADTRRKIDIVANVFSALKDRYRIWAYGAAGKATMWVNACEMTYLEAVIDASPLRAGKLMPGTHTPIVLPDEFKANPPDHVFVTAWNYADAIRANENWFRGTWSTPLPDLRFF